MCSSDLCGVIAPLIIIYAGFAVSSPPLLLALRATQSIIFVDPHMCYVRRYALSAYLLTHDSLHPTHTHAVVATTTRETVATNVDVDVDDIHT